MTSPARRLNSSVRAYWSSGSDPRRSTTSATIWATSPGSKRTPSASAGPSTARSSSAGDMRVMTSVPCRSSSPMDAVAERSVVEVGAQRHDERQLRARVDDGGGQGVEDVVGDRRRGLGEELLELIDDEQQP